MGNDIGGQEKVQHILVALFHVICQLHRGWGITEKVVNDIIATKTQCECVAAEYYCVDKTSSIGIYNQTDAQSP